MVCALAWVAGPGLPVLADPAAAGLPRALQAVSRPLRDAADLDPLLAAARHARLVLLGEASHGTHEFYTWRDRLTRRLLTEQDIAFVAIEGDWATLAPLDRYVRHDPAGPGSAREALLQIERWPRWVWANRELEAFAEWLRGFNADRPPARRVGIHGIDLYAVWESLDAVLDFYRVHAPAVLPRVVDAYRLLLPFDGDQHAYAAFTRRSAPPTGSGPSAVIRDLAARDDAVPAAMRGDLWQALQHAHVVAAGERYLRLMVLPGPQAWNVRARHMAATIGRLLGRYGPGSRAVVWAHNTHIGDARATAMHLAGELNLGQLSRERYGESAVFAVGLATAGGSVLAARRWDGPRQRMTVPPPRPDSLESALLAAGPGDRLLLFETDSPAGGLLQRWLPHRAIGVVFEVEGERRHNYVPTRPAGRYDAFIFLPQTRALQPLHAE